MLTPAEALRRASLIALALAGVGVASYLSIVHYASLEPICSHPRCETIQAARFAVAGGIPLAVWGLLMYLGILGCELLVARWPAGPVAAWAAMTAFGGAAYSLYLTYLEVSVIHSMCQWCIASTVIAVVIALLSTPDIAALLRRSKQMTTPSHR